MAETSAPCKDEAFVWRMCLKRDDYSPDRDTQRCEPKRQLYYNCLNEWRSKQHDAGATSQDFSFPQQCQGYATKLHGCMKLNMFQVEQCQDEMRALQDCAAQHDPRVRQARQYELGISPAETPSSSLWSKWFGSKK
jgi:hypothetical protein